MKIETSAIERVDKALVPSLENSFQLNDATPLVRKTQVKPRLLSAIFGGTANKIYSTTGTVRHDELVNSLQLPDGKAYDTYGSVLQKDTPRELSYRVGSFGITASVAPQDYMNRRIAGSNDLMDEAYLVAQMNQKLSDSWNMFDELKWAQLLTQDTNITRGGPMPQYNYYQDILGTSRPAATAIDLTGNTDIWSVMQTENDKMDEELEKTYNSSEVKIVICGSSFFDKRLELEKQTDIARELKTAIDLQSMNVPASNFGTGDGTYRYRYFDSIDGFRYIRYGAGIQGTKLIADDRAYILPVGADNFVREAFAPAQTRQYVNTEAQERYGWSYEHDRTGVTMIQESNCLPILVNPQLVTHLVDANP